MLVLALVTLAGCGTSLERNEDMNSAVRTFVAERSASRARSRSRHVGVGQVYVVSLDGVDADFVREVTGENVDVPWGS